MRDNALVYERVKRALEAKQKCAVATVVKVYGSAYRREGSKMFIDEAKNMVGMISGGCLEADVAEIAKEVMETGIPIIRHYNMDEDVVWGLGLGCPGEVDIYIEALNT